MLETIERLIDQGYGQRRIASELNISRDKLQTIFKRNNLKTRFVVQERSSDYPKRFNDYYKDRWTYVDGYTSNNCTINIMCKACGYTRHVNANALRKCQTINCSECKAQSKAQSKATIEAEKLRIEAERMQAKEERERTRLEETTELKTCLYCGKKFTTTRSRAKYCSRMCCKRAGYKKKEVTRRMRITANGEADWDISTDRLISRDGGVCHICGKRVDLGDYTVTRDGVFIAHGQYPSIDHVVPLSLGGAHTWDNVKLAHKSCNETKSNKIFYTTQGGQVVMAV